MGPQRLLAAIPWALSDVVMLITLALPLTLIVTPPPPLRSTRTHGFQSQSLGKGSAGRDGDGDDALEDAVVEGVAGERHRSRGGGPTVGVR